jgi:hypothetical protein
MNYSLVLPQEMIMKTAVWIVLIGMAQCLAFNVAAQDRLEFTGDCSYPDQPQGVDGSTASEAQMLNFQKEMKDYLAKGNAFLECLDKEEDQASKDASNEQLQEFKARITQTYNAVVDEMNGIADQFNTALKAYKAQNN